MNQLDLHNIFFPSQHIEDPRWFAGRKDDIEKALETLCNPGASMIVFGERGAGKTSFIEMIKQLATGQSYLLYKHKFQNKFPTERFKFKIVSTDCNAEINTTAKALQSIITSPNGIKGLLSSRMEKIESTVRDKFTIDFLKFFVISKEEEIKKSFSEFKEESIFEKFTNLILTISKDVLNKNEGLLIVIDEFDLIIDSSKMASLIKTLSRGNVKFLLAGIAESYEQLLAGHQSILRQLIYGRIHIRLMTDDEIKEVFRLVSENTKNALRFEESFINDVIEKSNRYPYFVQLFGKLSIDAYYKEKGYHTPMIIHSQYLKRGLEKIKLYEERMEKEYLSIIKDNSQKELIVKFLAKHSANKVNDEEIFSYCHKKDIMGAHPKNILASLLANREPHFLIREREDSDYVSFADRLFKTFVNSREPELIRVQNGEFIIPN